MTRIIRLSILFGLSAVLLSSCGGPKQSTPKGAAGKQPVSLEVAVFQGGYGLDFFQRAAKLYEQEHPNVTIKVWGNPRVWEQLRPRFVQGDVPDLSWPGWGMDVWSLVYEKQVFAMDKLLDGPSWDQPDKTWRQTFVPSLLKRGEYEGHQYILPYNFNVFAWWYDRTLFAKHGWKPPRTWDELLKLGEEIKATKIAPLTFQGRYPDYMLRGFFYPWAISVGGLKAYQDAQNLVPGAWKSEPFLRSAEMVADLVKRGFFQRGAMGMTHTESQMEFLMGRAAMIPCGTWLYSEMTKQIPPGFQMEMILPPSAPNAKGNPRLVHAATENWIVPAKGKYPEVGADLYRFMTSLKLAKEFVTKKGTLMSIVGSDQVKLPPYLVAPAKLIRAAPTTWHAEHGDWYPSLKNELWAAMAALLNAEITPQQCVDRIEAAAAKVRQDPRLPKHHVEY